MLWTRSFNLKVNAARQYAVLDPDLEIRGGGGGGGGNQKKFFLALGASVWSKMVGVGRGSWFPPLYPPLIQRIQFENNKVKKMKMTPEN